MQYVPFFLPTDAPCPPTGGISAEINRRLRAETTVDWEIRTWFRCNTSRECMPDIFRCEGVVQCLDRSDEMNCGKVLNILGTLMLETEKI